MTDMNPVFTPSWPDYELIDSGYGQKLERFGPHVLIRPEPQALWCPVLSVQEWDTMAHARFDREQKDRYRFSDEVNGGWRRNGMPENWNVAYESPIGLRMNLRLALTGFGHVGVFPEQGVNWDFIWKSVRDFSTRTGKSPRILNLFAYTGAASVAARLAGAEVTHVDASRPGLTWANHNMQLNGADNIRWVHEDALKFVRREVRRGNRYHGVIMDPPPYGRGPEGEKWTLQEKLDELIGQASALMDPDPVFFILSMYAAGLSAQVGRNLLRHHFDRGERECGEFLLRSRHGDDMPMGTLARISFIR